MNLLPRGPRPSVRIGEVAAFIRGVTYKPADVTVADDPLAIACMRTKNIQTDLEDDDLVFIPRSPIKPGKLLQAGDILVSSANSWNLVGKCCWVPDLPYQATFGGFTSVLRVDPSRAVARYVYHWFSTERIQQLARSFGQQTTNISNLNQARCLELEIPLPPLDEQRRIAAILDKADALRRKRGQAIETFNSLDESLFISIFGDPVENPHRYPARRLIDLVDKQRGISYGIVQRGDDQDEGVSVLRISDFQDGIVLTSGLKKTTPQIASQYQRTSLVGGELVISIRGTVGRCAEIPAQLVGANVSREVAVMPTLDKSSNSFYLSLLRTQAVQKRLSRDIKGVAQSGVNLEDLRELLVIEPPAAKLAFFLRAQTIVDKLRRDGRAFSERADSLFSSLQHRAFSGKL